MTKLELLIALENHIKAWKQIGYLFTLKELRELQVIYKTKTLPEWAVKECVAEAP